MAQKRMIHRRILESEKIQALRGNDRARFLYAALLPLTDKLGRVNVNIYGLKGTILEPFEYTIDEIRDALYSLAAVGLVRLYRTPKHDLLAQYEQFEKFNRPHPNEADSDLPGPDDPSSEIISPEPSGNLPGNDPDGEEGDTSHAGAASQTRAALPGSFPETSGKRVIAGSSYTHTPTPTQDLDLQEEDTRDFDETPEAAFARLATTGRSDHTETARARAVIRRLAGAKFASEHEASMRSWSRHTTERLTQLWAASNPRLWPKEPGKRRPWFFTDLLNEERFPPGEDAPERVYEDVDGGDLLGIGSPNGTWGPS